MISISGGVNRSRSFRIQVDQGYGYQSVSFRWVVDIQCPQYISFDEIDGRAEGNRSRHYPRKTQPLDRIIRKEIPSIQHSKPYPPVGSSMKKLAAAAPFDLSRIAKFNTTPFHSDPNAKLVRRFLWPREFQVYSNFRSRSETKRQKKSPRKSRASFSHVGSPN